MRLVSIILFFLLIVSCKREKCPFPGSEIEGIVIDDSTNTPIEGATIMLQRKKCEMGLTRSTCHCIDIKDIKSDSEGKFKLKFCKSKNRDYAVDITKDGYYPSQYYSCGGGCGMCYDDFLNSDRVIKLKRQ